MKSVIYISSVTLPEQYAGHAGDTRELPDEIADQFIADGVARYAVEVLHVFADEGTDSLGE